MKRTTKTTIKPRTSKAWVAGNSSGAKLPYKPRPQQGTPGTAWLFEDNQPILWENNDYLTF